MDIFVAAVLLAALVAATITDLKSQRIPNWLTFPLMVTGLVIHTLNGGGEGLGFSAAGFGLGFGVMLVPYLFGLMGAGDVKLMAGVGAWLGIDTAFTAFLCTCFAGGAYSLFVMFRNTEILKTVFSNIWTHFVLVLFTKEFDYTPTSSDRTLPRLCYGVAIAFGTLASMALTFRETGGVFIR